jgi:hypothetical protein
MLMGTRRIVLGLLMRRLFVGEFGCVSLMLSLNCLVQILDVFWCLGPLLEGLMQPDLWSSIRPSRDILA